MKSDIFTFLRKFTLQILLDIWGFALSRLLEPFGVLRGSTPVLVPRGRVRVLQQFFRGAGLRIVERSAPREAEASPGEGFWDFW